MKSLLPFASTVVLLVGCQEQSTVLLHVPDMYCESCVAKVTEVLSEQPGVESVSVDLETKQASLAIDRAVFDSEAAIATLVDYQFTNSQLESDLKKNLTQ